MTVYIYALIDPRTREAKYVGKTINIEARLKGHKADKKNCYKTAWLQSLLEFGDLPGVMVLETIENSDDQDWQEAERYWINQLRFYGAKLCNLDSGGAGGKRHCAETIRKIGEGNKGKKMPGWLKLRLTALSLGRKMTEANKQKLSDRTKGKKRSEATKAKIAAAHLGKKGRPMSEEQKEFRRQWRPSAEIRARMAEAQKGRIQSEATKEKLRAWNTGRRMSDAARLKMSLAAKRRCSKIRLVA